MRSNLDTFLHSNNTHRYTHAGVCWGCAMDMPPKDPPPMGANYYGEFFVVFLSIITLANIHLKLVCFLNVPLLTLFR